MSVSHNHLAALIGNLPDPEIPAVSLADLGIFRGISEQDGTWVVALTPTYTGCPATEAIKAQVKETLAGAGYANVRVNISLSPAWSSDWISSEGRDKLRAFGIAPPASDAAESFDGCIANHAGGASNVLQFKAPDKGIACPLCSSRQTKRISQFGSTPCKALYRCITCREPFDYFKPY